jgi:beta-lactamase regulating signal transducer with metallopeptidase domain
MMSILADSAVFLSNVAGLSILVKATLVLGLGLGAAWLAGRQRASLRHLLLAATFAALMALPSVLLFGPDVSIAMPAARQIDVRDSQPTTAVRNDAGPVTRANATTPTQTVAAFPSVPALAVGLWGLGAILIVGSLVSDLWRVRRVVRQGLPWIDRQHRVEAIAGESGVRRPVAVLRHEAVPAPFTCGLWRPTIMLPADAAGWSDADLDRALVHELEHIRRGDWAVQLAARVACACYWCHPLVWAAWRRLCLEAERACDDAVVQRAERTDYAEQLVTMARRMSSGHAEAVLGMANRSDLASRVTALLDGSQRRGRAGLVPTAAAIAAAIILAALVAPVRAVPLPPEGARSAAMSSSAPGQGGTASVRRRPNALDRALFEAAREGDTGAMAEVVAAGADLNAAIAGDGSPLIGAARAGRLDAVRWLLERGASPDLAVEGDGNALIMAAAAGHLDVVTLLLDRGANVEQVVPRDENALIQASANGRLAVAKLLVSRGANVNARVWADDRAAGEWRTPLGMARRGRHSAVVAFLESAGAVE